MEIAVAKGAATNPAEKSRTRSTTLQKGPTISLQLHDWKSLNSTFESYVPPSMRMVNSPSSGE